MNLYEFSIKDWIKFLGEDKVSTLRLHVYDNDTLKEIKKVDIKDIKKINKEILYIYADKIEIENNNYIIHTSIDNDLLDTLL